MSLDAIAQMSCNPAIGGTAKGHLVREIDALGGEMGRTTDRAAIQVKTLNASRGPAVRSTRAQCDRARYRGAMKQTVEAEPRLDVRQGQARRFLVDRRPRGRRRGPDGRALRGARGRRHRRHLPPRAHSRRRRTAARGTRGRVRRRRSLGRAPRARSHARPPEDRHVAAAAPLQHRLRGTGRAVGRRAAVAVPLGDRRGCRCPRWRATSPTRRPRRTRSFARTSIARRSTPASSTRPGCATAPRSRTRWSASRTATVTR